MFSLYYFDNLVRDIVQRGVVLSSKMKFYLRVFFFWLSEGPVRIIFILEMYMASLKRLKEFDPKNV